MTAQVTKSRWYYGAIHSTPAPGGSSLTISTSCPPVPRHARFFPNLRWYHIGVSEALVISSCTPLISRCLPLILVHRPADGLDARRRQVHNFSDFSYKARTAHTTSVTTSPVSVRMLHCISCGHCNCLYIGETGRPVRERFSEHLRSIRNGSRGFPVDEHFNSASHSLDNITVCGLKQCSGDKTSTASSMK